MASLLPIFLDLHSKSVLVVGGGQVALEKLIKLVVTGAQIEVVATQLQAETRAWLDAHAIPWHERAFVPTDLDGRFLLISAVNDASVHAAIAAAARTRGILTNAVDAPRSSDFYFGAQVQRGALQLAISTQGLFPGVARAIRLWLEEIFPQDITTEFDDLVSLRQSVQARLPDPVQRMRALKEQLQIWSNKGLQL